MRKEDSLFSNETVCFPMEGSNCRALYYYYHILGGGGGISLLYNYGRLFSRSSSNGHDNTPQSISHILIFNEDTKWVGIILQINPNLITAREYTPDLFLLKELQMPSL